MSVTLHRAKKSKQAAFCKVKKVYLSFRQVRAKGCIDSKKQQGKYGNAISVCPYLVKLDHPIWEEKEILKNKRKERKMKKED